MQTKLIVLMAQINPTAGAIESNTQKIIQIIQDNQEHCDIIVFPELTVCAYSPEDLLLRKEFQQSMVKSLAAIQETVTDCHVIVGHPSLEKEDCFNSLSLIHQGEILKTYHKHHLPNYGVFDECRYFKSGPISPCVFELKSHKIGLCICEDIWHPGPVEALIQEGVSTVIAMNASPFDYTKNELRETLIKSYTDAGVNFIYVNQVGGQDDLLFDGVSFAMDKSGAVCARLPAFEEALCPVELTHETMHGSIAPLLTKEALVYKALVCATRDYVQKNHFPGVLLGLSGGIDSALTLAIAVDALGADKVHALVLPSRYSSPMSHEDASTQLNTLQVSHNTLSIEPAFLAFLSSLEPLFKDLPQDTTEENIQARIRGILLMAVSNKSGKMVLNTSNKSESAVGYATLYGDMCGGFSVLKDVLKTDVYALARYRNAQSEIIPERVLLRAPSAELRENQTDQDSLPDYAVLDAIITGYMENELSPEEIIQLGHKEVDVLKVIRLIKLNEYKRRQAAPGPKISPMAFGKDWRYPITKGLE